MRRLYLICILFAFIACSCDDDDDIFSANSVERVEAVIADCDAILKTPAQGWHAVYVPNPELTGAFNILMKFDEGGMVRMDGDFVENESYSAYSYNSSKGPVLCFDTYAAIHALADPTGEDSRLKPSGLEGDFEFIIKSVSADSVVLIGKKREQKLVLYPATADQWTVLLPNAREYLKKFSPKANAEFFRILTIADGAESINLVYDSLYRSAAITWADHANRSTETFTTAILGTESGVAFRPALEINGYKVSRLNYDAVSGLFKIDESADGIRGELKYMNEPPFPFYDSYTSLLENTNAGVTPLVGQMDLSMYGLMELLKVFSNSNEFSEEFRSSYSSAVLTGLKQFKLAWKSPLNAMDEGKWFTYFGSNGGYLVSMLSAASLYSFVGIEDEILRATNDQVRFSYKKENGVKLTFNTDQTFANTMETLEFVQMLETFLTEPAGFTVVPAGEYQYYLIHKDNSKRWIRLTKN